MALFGRPSPEQEQRASNYRAWLEKRHPFALASLVLGVFSFTHLGTLIVDSIAAIALGAIAIRQLAAGSTNRNEGKRLAIAGMALGAASLVVAGMLYFHR